MFYCGWEHAAGDYTLLPMMSWTLILTTLYEAASVLDNTFFVLWEITVTRAKSSHLDAVPGLPRFYGGLRGTQGCFSVSTLAQNAKPCFSGWTLLRLKIVKKTCRWVKRRIKTLVYSNLIPMVCMIMICAPLTSAQCTNFYAYIYIAISNII